MFYYKTSVMKIWILKIGLLSFLLLSLGRVALRAQGLPREMAGPVMSMPDPVSRIVRPASVDSLLYRKFVSRLKNPDMGFRILIFSQSGNHSKNAAMQAKADFEMLYPGTKVYLTFEEPYFKVKVGNFLERMNAEFFLREIRLDYPYAFIVKDELDIPYYLGMGK